MEDKKTFWKEPVNWTVFVWAIGIVTTTLIIVINNQMNLSSKINSNDVEFAKLTTKLEQIQTDILDIKTTLKDKK